jgi:hypothetical protein
MSVVALCRKVPVEGVPFQLFHGKIGLLDTHLRKSPVHYNAQFRMVYARIRQSLWQNRLRQYHMLLSRHSNVRCQKRCYKCCVDVNAAGQKGFKPEFRDLLLDSFSEILSIARALNLL